LDQGLDLTDENRFVAVIVGQCSQNRSVGGHGYGRHGPTLLLEPADEFRREMLAVAGAAAIAHQIHGMPASDRFPAGLGETGNIGQALRLHVGNRPRVLLDQRQVVHRPALHFHPLRTAAQGALGRGEDFHDLQTGVAVGNRFFAGSNAFDQLLDFVA